MEKLLIRREEPCFENILGLIVSHVTYSVALAAYEERNLSSILKDDPCLYQGTPHTTNLELETRVKNWILQISDNNWPNEIEFEITKLGTKKPYMGAPWEVPKSDIFGEWQAISTYVSFYEQVIDLIEKKHGKDCNSWPDIFNFARICRNALAHGNKINIKNKKSKKYSWRNLSYGPTDNGRKVIFSDFSFADLIILMKDISDNL